MKKLLKKGDYILLAVILCVCTISFLVINYFLPFGSEAVISVDNQIVNVMKLSENDKYDVKINNDVTNTVVVENGYVYVEYANCPDKICQNHKKIRRKGESIVCLPNKVVVTIDSKNSNDEIDGVAK